MMAKNMNTNKGKKNADGLTEVSVLRNTPGKAPHMMRTRKRMNAILPPGAPTAGTGKPPAVDLAKSLGFDAEQMTAESYAALFDSHREGTLSNTGAAVLDRVRPGWREEVAAEELETADTLQGMAESRLRAGEAPGGWQVPGSPVNQLCTAAALRDRSGWMNPYVDPDGPEELRQTTMDGASLVTLEYLAENDASKGLRYQARTQAAFRREAFATQFGPSEWGASASVKDKLAKLERFGGYWQMSPATLKAATKDKSGKVRSAAAAKLAANANNTPWWMRNPNADGTLKLMETIPARYRTEAK